MKNACSKGVEIIAYDSEITEPCAYNVSIDQPEAGRVTAEITSAKPLDPTQLSQITAALEKLGARWN